MRLRQTFYTFILIGVCLFTFNAQSFAQSLPSQPPGKSVFLDGLNDYVEIINSQGVNSPAITIEAWIKPCANGIMTIVSKKHPTLPFDNYSFSVNNGRLRWVFRENGDFNNSANIVESSQQIVTTGVWQHVAVVHNSNISRPTLYYNGVQLDPMTEVTYIGMLYPLGATGGTIKVGITPTSQGNFLWQGNIDEVAIWNYARSSALIMDDADGTTPFGISANVEAYLDMEVDAVGFNAILPNAGTTGVNNGQMKNWMNPNVTSSPFTILNGVDVCCVAGNSMRLAPPATGSVSVEKANRLEIAPNPNQGTFKVSWPAEAGQTAQGEISDLVTGKVIFKGTMTRDQEISLPQGTAGTLVISILTENGHQLNGKTIANLK